MAVSGINVEVASPAEPNTSEPIHLILDSGLNYSVVPADVLERLGHQTADG